MIIYVVAPGDTVNSVSSKFGLPPDTVVYMNQLYYPYRLAVGQALLLPGGPERSGRKLIHSNGYAYPFIDSFVLNQTLPYMSDLSVFSYGFSPEGSLIPPVMDDTWMIRAASASGSNPILTLTPFGADGRFNNNLISAMLNNPEAQYNLIAQLREMALSKGFRGVDIDFEYIKSEDRFLFAEFVTRVRENINQIGYPVSVALAPKTSDNQPGLLYAGKDYALLGKAADNVLLMTYEWGYTYGTPMAVAPINNVRQVVEYALTRIPAEKINLGIPNYGYDWPLPYQRGVTRAETIGNIQAIQIAINNNAAIEFDEVSMSPFFQYTRNGTEHQVWFEDVRSYQAKFNLVYEYNLRGIGCWQLMRLFRPGYLLMADTFWIEASSVAM